MRNTYCLVPTSRTHPELKSCCARRRHDGIILLSETGESHLWILDKPTSTLGWLLTLRAHQKTWSAPWSAILWAEWGDHFLYLLSNGKWWRGEPVVQFWHIWACAKVIPTPSKLQQEEVLKKKIDFRAKPASLEEIRKPTEIRTQPNSFSAYHQETEPWPSLKLTVRPWK